MRNFAPASRMAVTPTWLEQEWAKDEAEHPSSMLVKHTTHCWERILHEGEGREIHLFFSPNGKVNVVVSP